MKRPSLHHTFFLLAFLAGIMVHAATVTPYKGSRLFWDETTRVVVFPSGGYARVLKLQDGRLMAVCESGGIKCAFSSDMGATWTSPQLIASNPSKVSECVPDLIQLTDGTIIVAYNPRPHEPYSEERRFGIRCRRSTNKGRTWSDEIFVNDASWTFIDGCWEPSMLELPSGELQLYFADEGPYTNSGEQQISLCRSWDKGLTWSKPERISFRAGARDGMPVPILLQDQSEIVVAIEDNGWGYGTFYPTTVRTSLTNNWKDGYVDASSSRRAKAANTDITPTWLGGAPYLRQLPCGETVLSYQSDHAKSGVFQMVAAVGDSQARNFHGLCHPFVYTEGQGIMWNSVSPIGYDTIMAVGGVAGKIEVVKGVLLSQFECPFNTPNVDGRFAASDKYPGRKSPSIHFAGETGNIYQTDFCYDNDSLYFIVRGYDKTITSSGEQLDGVRLSIETKGRSSNNVMTSAYQYLFTVDGQVTRLGGQGSAFKTKAGSQARAQARKTASNYVIEVAIPWSDLSLTAAPTETMPRVNIEVIDVSPKGVNTKMIPDARNLEPWTWMPLHFGENPTAIIPVVTPFKPSKDIYNLSGHRITNMQRGINIINGKKVAHN